VSYSSKATSPDRTLPPEARRRDISDSSSSVPCCRVRPKRFSSTLIICSTIRRLSTISLYGSPIRLITSGMKSTRKGRSTPSRRPKRAARRSSLRSTYPRPSLDGSIPSAIMNTTERTWSAMTLAARSFLELSPYLIPPSAQALSISGRNRSVSKSVRTLCTTEARRSSPIPVSMFFFGSGTSVPSFCRSNWVKTRFQISRYLSQLHPTAQSGLPQENSGPWSYMISEQGPHGPWVPMNQKLASLSKREILSSGSPTSLCHTS